MMFKKSIELYPYDRYVALGNDTWSLYNLKRFWGLHFKTLRLKIIIKD